MLAAACAVGRLGADGPWIGFVPTMADGYALVVGREDRIVAVDERTERSDLLALAIAYFADELGEPPESLAATHGDIGALVRAVAEAETDPSMRASLGEAVDAVDDGLAADVVVGRLSRCLADDEEALTRLVRRANELLDR